ncbi:hypothetical protein AVEN_226223-1 [Araneus ventricosus]|uniref:Peptidase aspartic putative domain-containing protein n=1 Tax=Araneus ventricosus TaxID=182803 RepID=A0A4Y2J4L4_ARAVE|nr:hypothetical protein AVEN_226223-1 [Araneus ventricosus]
MTEDPGFLIKKKRAALRTAVTKCIQQLEKEFKKNEPDDGEVEELLEHLSEKFESLKVVDRECENLYKPAEIDKEKRHHDILCFSSNNSAKESKEKIATDEDTTLSNSSRSKEVLLQTLVVCIKGKRSDTFVKVILDTVARETTIKVHGRGSRSISIRDLLRVVFGTSSSPFLLGATLEHHLKEVTGHLKVTAQKLLESFYVDNCETSVDNDEHLGIVILEWREILSPAKFNLRGWEHTSVSTGEKRTILEEEKKVPVLGLIWKPNKDTLSVNWEETSKIKETPITKRKILSAVHRIFDPIGFICPVTLKPKILLHECWKLGVTWETELPFSI